MKLKNTPLVSLIYAIFYTSCSYKVGSPPTKFSSLDSPKVLEKNETKISAEADGISELFGPDLTVYSLTFAQGTRNKNEYSIQPFFGEFNQNITDETIYPLIAGIHFNYKTNPWNYFDKHFAIQGGVGYLYSYYGQVISLNGGWNLGYENENLVPYISQDFFTNQPFFAKKIPTEDVSIIKSNRQKPTFTYGTKITTGLKLHLSEQLSVGAGFGFYFAKSQTHDLNRFHGGVGLDYKL